MHLDNHVAVVCFARRRSMIIIMITMTAWILYGRKCSDKYHGQTYARVLVLYRKQFMCQSKNDWSFELSIPLAHRNIQVFTVKPLFLTTGTYFMWRCGIISFGLCIIIIIDARALQRT